MSITPRHLAGLAGNYTFADDHPAIPSLATTIATNATVVSKSRSQSRPISRTDLARNTVLPLTPPSSDNDNERSKPGVASGEVPLSSSASSVRPVLGRAKSESKKDKGTRMKGNVGGAEVKVRDFGRKVIVEEEEQEDQDQESEDRVRIRDTEDLQKTSTSIPVNTDLQKFLIPSAASTAVTATTPSATPSTTSLRRSRLISKLGRDMYLYRLSHIQAVRSGGRRRRWIAPGQVKVLRALIALDEKESGKEEPRRFADTSASVKAQEDQDEVGDLLVSHLKGLLRAKTPVLSESPVPVTPAATEQVKVESEEEATVSLPRINFPPITFTLDREALPTPIPNPIRYPRGYVPPTNTFQSSAEESTAEEVSVEFIKPVPRVIKVLQGMTGRMREKFEGEAWVRRLDDEVQAGLIEDEVKVESDTEAETDPGMRQVRDEVERFLVDGKEGEVRWEEGVGRLVSQVKVEEGSEVFGDVYVFLDHSNIHHGMISTLVSRPLPNLTVGTKKILNIPILSLLMLRGRRPARDGMHLVASAPLTQGLDGAVKMGWRCCVLKRVEVDRKAGDGSSESEEREREKVPVKGKKGGKKAWTSAIVKDETEATTTGTDSDTPAVTRPLVLPNLNDPSITSRRMREQAVDELLHLQILQTLLFSPQPGTLVLGTGDAKGGQFNDLGFLGCVKLAVERGWKVELWTWRKGTSRMWREEAKRMGWGRRQFKICELDDWVEEVVMEKESSGKRSRRR